MSTQLLDIHPCELKFTFEVKKQSSCAIQLVNISNQCVAFKVKTTSPKKYCVRPNVGIIKPKSKCDFTVTMQAQRSAPSDMQCKDKFLIQSTTVPLGTTDEDITPGMFTKDEGRHIEESKLRVVLHSPPHSPVLLPVNGALKQEPSCEQSVQKENLLGGVENLPPVLAEDVENAPVVGELKPGIVKDVDTRSNKDVELSPSKDSNSVKNVDKKLKLTREFEELKSKLNIVESKLNEADYTITRLTQERNKNIKEKEMLKQELATLKRMPEMRGRRVQEGFPFLFVCMVALISLTVGYLSNS